MKSGSRYGIFNIYILIRKIDKFNRHLRKVSIMEMKALFLNCTLKKSPQVSNTRALVDKAVAIFKELGVESEVVRVVDHKVAFGVSSDEGEGDEWPLILEKIKACNILVIATPIWFGVLSSVAKMVIERLDGTYMEGNPETGQYPPFTEKRRELLLPEMKMEHTMSVQLYSSALPTWAVPCLQMLTVIGLVMRVPVRVI